MGFIKKFSVEVGLPLIPLPNNGQVEMLVIKECVQQISGLSEHTLSN